MDWLFYEQLDRLRRAQALACDAAGLGLEQTPYREVFRAPGVALRDYGAAAHEAPALFIVPAPIKRASIWDLAPQVSAVRRCLDAGARVRLVDWQPAPSGFGLAEYAERLILECLDAAQVERAVLLAHSLGGLFAAILAALHPERIQGLALLASPLRFGAATPVLAALTEGLRAETLPASLPGSFLSAASARAAPGVFGLERLFDAWLSAADPARLRTHWQVERWALDEFALPRGLVADLAARIIEGDAFYAGSLSVNGRRATPQDIRAPLLCVFDPHCPIVPPEAVLPAVAAAESADKVVLTYEPELGVGLQHVGPLVGRRAHASLWPRIASWIARVGVSAAGRARPSA